MRKTWKWRLAQTIELKWWRNYLGDKDKETYLAWKRGYWNGVLEKITPSLNLKPGMRALDAGCGPAGIFMVLNDQKTDALDPLLDQYEKELEHFSKKDYPDVHFHAIPLEELKAEAQYDVVFCMNAINHVSQLDLCYNLLVNAVKPGGQLIVTIDAHNHNMFKHLVRIIPGDILHPHQYDLKEYEKMLTSRNCKMLQTLRLKKEILFDHYIQVAERGV